MFFAPRFVCLLFVFQLVFLGASAQILNVEKTRMERDSARYFTGNLGFNLNLFNRPEGTEGGTDHFIGLTFNGNLGYVSDQNTYLLLGSYNYVRLRDEIQVETGFVHGRVTFNRLARLAFETYGQLQYDYNRGLELRHLVGAGARYQLVRNKNVRLNLGSGLMYEHERWRNPADGGYIIKDIPKMSNYISVRLPLNPYLELSTIHYYQFGFDQPSSMWRHRFSGDISVTMKINTRFQLITSFNHTYENRPIVPIPGYLYNLTNGLQVSF